MRRASSSTAPVRARTKRATASLRGPSFVDEPSTTTTARALVLTSASTGSPAGETLPVQAASSAGASANADKRGDASASQPTGTERRDKGRIAALQRSRRGSPAEPRRSPSEVERIQRLRSGIASDRVGSTCDLLVLAAFPPELAPLRATLGEGLRRQFGGHDVVAEAVGIGIPHAAAGAARKLGVLHPRGVVLVGTCGAFGDSIPIGGVAVARRIVLAEPAVARGEAAYPDPMTTELLADRALGEALVGSGAGAAKLVDVATTLAVTTDDPLAARLAAFTSCQAEHLEAYGVAAASAALGVPFVTALGVANRVGAAGRAEWRQNHRAASAAAIDVLVGWIAAGANGLGPRENG